MRPSDRKRVLGGVSVWLLLSGTFSIAADPVPPSLADIKATGARQSAYRDYQAQELGTEAPEPRLETFSQRVEPVLRANCYRCHGPKKQKGSFRIDTLDPNLLHGEDVNWWVDIVGVISNGEMPPEDEDPMSDSDRETVINWLTTEIQIASQVRRSEEGHSSFRRMTRYEFNYALQDLLQLPHNFAKDLPPEAHSEDGFQNSSELLHLSAIQFETYRELSLAALNSATVKGSQPAPLYWSVSMAAAASREWDKQEEQLAKIRRDNADNPDEREKKLNRQKARFRSRRNQTHYRDLETDRTANYRWGYGGARYAWAPTGTPRTVPAPSQHVAVIPALRSMIVELGDQVPETGTLRVRVRAARASLDTPHAPNLQLEFGWQASNNSRSDFRISSHDLVIDAPPGQPQFYQWEVPLRDLYPRNSVKGINRMGETPSPSEFIKLVNSSASSGAIQVDYVEVVAPVYASWPPASHRNIFHVSPNQANEAIYAREVLERFMPRAWRRPIRTEELTQKLNLFDRLRPLCDDFQDAITEVLATVLASPKFLYVIQSEAGSGPEQLTDAELATRLAMFLWSSGPDHELHTLAALGRLRDPMVLRQQTERLLADPRSQRLATHFVRQWLGMQLLDYLQIDREFFSQYDTALQEAMQEEPIQFFQNLLAENRSVLDFLHANFTMVNERLARHYGFSDVYGTHFRPVALQASDPRGGLLTQAGLLAMNSDGKDSHPLKRGIWLLERLLNDPPPPPPPAVPEIDLSDPEIAKLTLKERIEDHRDDAACRSCHVKIDPWGIAFENFDAVGRWRDTIQEKPVDATSTLFNNQELRGMDGLKRFLLANRQDQFCRAFVHKLTTYALGRPLTFSDRAEIDAITAASRKKEDRLKEIVHLIISSKLFQTK